MPKLPALTSKEVIAILVKKGFEIRRSSGSHQMLYNIQTQKRTTVPYHSKDLPKGTLLSIIKSAGLTKEDFS